MNNIVIVKHGERLDEVHPKYLWASYCHDHCENSYDYNCRLNDPPLAHSGNLQAQELGLTLRKQIDIDNVQFIFSSKLLRCVETAREIALVLNKPIILSTTFSLNSKGCQQLGYFDFLSFEDIQSSYPDVNFIDGDDESNYTSNIPCDVWKDSIQHVMAAYPQSIVVCHGETIEEMANRHLSTPSCCFGIFEYDCSYFDIIFRDVYDYTGKRLTDAADFGIEKQSPSINRKRKSEDLSDNVLSEIQDDCCCHQDTSAFSSDDMISAEDELPIAGQICQHASSRLVSGKWPHGKTAMNTHEHIRISVTKELDCAFQCDADGCDSMVDGWRHSPKL